MMMTKMMTRILMNILAVVVVSQGGVVDARVACNESRICQQMLLPSSYCGDDGYCTNPFTNGGCLHQMMPGWNKLRLCNSEDDLPDAAIQGLCRQPNEGFEHLEVRLFSQNWESGFIVSWLLQILLSELLDVPTTIETGTPDALSNFYDINSPMDYGKSNHWDSFLVGNRLGDCRKASKQRKSNDGEEDEVYESCAHFISEVWDTRVADVKNIMLNSDKPPFEPPLASGMLGEIGWYIPRKTAEADPTLLSYLGYQGEENRQKLAETFLTPTTWGEYCDLLSSDGCATDDGVAKRAPADETEHDRMYADGIYTGYFRKTDGNDCDLNPTSCKGHVTDFPCDWMSYTYPYLYHMDIGLDVPMHYTYSQLVEIYHAANATNSNVILQWWSPEALFEQYADSEYEFLPVRMTSPNQECYDNRINVTKRCSEDPTIRNGNAAGVCGEAPEMLHKVIGTGLYEATHDPSIDEARRSPAHDALQLFLIDSRQIGSIFRKWYRRGVDKDNFDLRHATCEWFVENFDSIQRNYVPRSYPRVIDEDQSRPDALYITALAFAAFSIILVLISMVITYTKRNTAAILYAQVDFLWILLTGLLVIAIGALLLALKPSDGLCVASSWFIYLGYTLELVPLIVKVGALNVIMQSARKMKRKVLRKKDLFGTVVLITFLSVIFLTCWTIIDPPRKQPEYELTSEINENDETVVLVSYHCASDVDYWQLAAVFVIFIYLIIATVLAFQTRKVPQSFNESKTMAAMIYSHFLFAIIRITLLLLEGRTISSASVRVGFLSIITSFDVTATICIYFVPKFIRKKDGAQSNIAQQKISIFWDVSQRTGGCNDGQNRILDDNKDCCLTCGQQLPLFPTPTPPEQSEQQYHDDPSTELCRDDPA